MSGSFGDLLAQAGLKASAGASEAAVEQPTPPSTGPDFAPKVVVRRTKAGRGGKVVTLVQGIRSGHGEVAKALRKQLGTGARVDGEDVAVQGDQRDRVASWLEAQGVAKVIKS